VRSSFTLKINTKLPSGEEAWERDSSEKKRSCPFPLRQIETLRALLLLPRPGEE
jgi:hypothetical protein